MSQIILILILPAIFHTATPRVQHHLGSRSLDAKAAFLPDWTDGTIDLSSSAPVSTPVSGCKAVQGHYKGFQQNDPWKTFKHHLEDYSHFHHRQLLKLRSGNGSIRTLTWSCFKPVSCCGIGDQLYNIQQTLVYAIISKRVLSLYWNPTTYKTMRYLRPNKINWTYFYESKGMRKHHDDDQYRLGMARTVEYYEPFYAKLMSEEDVHLTVNHELQVPFIRGIKVASTSPLINRTLAEFGITALLTDNSSTNIPLEIFSGELLRYLFSFEKSVTDKVEQIQRQLGLLYIPYLAVHIRTGFFGMEHDEGIHFNSRKAFRNSTFWEKTIRCSIKLTNELFGKDYPIYLATDSNVVKRIAKSRFGQRVKTANLTLQHVALTKTKPKGITKKGLLKPSTHINVTERPKDAMETVSVGGVDGYMATWVDFLLMARSSTLVHSISGFLVTAGQLCSIERQYLVPNCTPKIRHRHRKEQQHETQY